MSLPAFINREGDGTCTWIGRPARVVVQAGPTGRVQEAGGRTRPTRVPGEAPVGGAVNKPEIFRTGVNKHGL